MISEHKRAEFERSPTFCSFILRAGKPIFEVVLDAVFPHKCVCGKWGMLLCDECQESIRVNKTGLCPVCKRISEYGRTCPACRHKSNLTGVMILGPHKDVLKALIWKLKYKYVKDVSIPLADMVVDRFGGFLHDKRFLVSYSPISKEHLNLRGFNQAELLARGVASGLGLECQDLLYKSNRVTSQVGHSRAERLRNLAGTMKYIGPAITINKKVLVVDDVYTTGATLEECARVLRAAGYREVWGIVLSRD